MDTKLIYQAIAGIYDLLDVVYFRDEKRSPRKAVLAKIKQKDKVLDLCTGSGCIGLSLLRFTNYTNLVATDRSEERRVGKECRSRWSPYH